MAVKEESVFVAEGAGFCTGVTRSMSNLDDRMMKKNGHPIYCSEPMVHNEVVMKPFYDRGLKIYKDGDEVPEGSIMVISAHGASPVEIKSFMKKGFIIYDPEATTCPFVLRFQDKVRKISESHRILIVGDPTHQEIKGVIGQIQGTRTPIIIDSVEKADVAPIEKAGKVAVFCQTTYNQADFDKICDVLKEKNSDITVFNTICKSVAKRVAFAMELAATVEVMFVLGSKTSSNTRHLADIIGRIIHTELVQNAKSLEGYGIEQRILNDLIRTASEIGVTAGASTSHETVDEFVEAVKNIRSAA